MSYIMGGTTGDDITIATTGGANINGQSSLIGGWFYPTTLTASRFLCSRGNTIGLSIDTVTTTLRFFGNNATTAGQWTAPANLVVNKWQWFAVMLTNLNTNTPPVAVRMWAGDANTSPTELTVTTATTPVGNATGSTSWTIGNRGTGTVAFQGRVAEQFVLSAIAGDLYQDNVGTITNADAANVQRYVLVPLWQCRPELLVARPLIATKGIDLTYWPGQLDVGGAAGTFDGQAWAWIGTADGYKQAVFGSSAAFSAEAPPMRSRGRWGIAAMPEFDW